MSVMTENERRILNELTKESSLSKRDVTLRCGMGWATAVKLMTRLEEQGFIIPVGSERQNGAGKTATVYTLAPRRPAAIGIDIEYARARVSIRNLAGESLFDAEQKTPPFSDPAELTDFLAALLDAASAKAVDLGVSLGGAGVGVPSHLFGNEGTAYDVLAGELSARAGFVVRVDNNIRCFTAAKASAADPGSSMLVVTIRSGIGVGIVLGGHIYQGERGCAGEIGHTPVDPAGRRCRCGKIGCLETIVNREALAADLEAAALGEAAARLRVDRAANLLGTAIASTMLVLDVRQVEIFAELGEPGQAFATLVRKAAQRAMYPGFAFELRYETLDAKAYVEGAAQLILNEYIR